MLKILIYSLITVFIIAVVFFIAVRLGLLAGSKPDNIGIVDNQLTACPNKANCVSSYSSNKKYFIHPLPFYQNQKQSIATIRAVLDEIKGISVLIEKPNYLYAKCTSELLGFVDDLEILCDSNSKQCHVRSASRLGHSDFGVNRKRIENIRKQLPAAN